MPYRDYTSLRVEMFDDISAGLSNSAPRDRAEIGLVARVTLSRPKLRNAFDDTMIAELTTAFDALGRLGELRAIVLASTGPAFCAGADLNWMRRMAGYSEDENVADARKLADMLHTIDQCPKPIVARVQGDAFAGGLGLIAVSDIVVAERNAHLCLSEARLGLIPATISPYVVRAIGESAARRYFMTAEVFDAVQARSLGLVHEAVDMAELDHVVDTLVHTLVRNGPRAVAECKRLVRDVAGRPVDEALRDETARRIAAARMSAEGSEGVQAFLDKREPEWRSRIRATLGRDE